VPQVFIASISSSSEKWIFTLFSAEKRLNRVISIGEVIRKPFENRIERICVSFLARVGLTA
jgi:hypothetical protein